MIHIIIFPFLLPVVEGLENEGLDKLPIQINSIPLKDRDNVKKITEEKTSFLNWRDEEIKTGAGIFNYILDRPEFTPTILTELDIANYQIEGEGKILHFDDGEGMTGELKMLYKRGNERMYQGTYLYTAGIGVPLRLSGEWVSVLKYNEKGEELGIDIDLYLKSGDSGLGRVTKEIPIIIESIMFERINFYIDSLRELSELIQSEPDDVYDRLKESREISKKELKELETNFKKWKGTKRK
ncbi:MAG: hypothetical protein HY578_00465 [Nitrospinae bacterium]|nr:hypothetical protein [Nitrospinota bacterium]